MLDTISTEKLKLEKTKANLEKITEDYERFNCPLWVKKIHCAIIRTNEAIKELESILTSTQGLK